MPADSTQSPVGIASGNSKHHLDRLDNDSLVCDHRVPVEGLALADSTQSPVGIVLDNSKPYPDR